jgi:hypothetical protein
MRTKHIEAARRRSSTLVTRSCSTLQHGSQRGCQSHDSAGRHRLEAHRQMGLTKIRFEYISKKADKNLVEIDENLIRRELTKPEREGMQRDKAAVMIAVEARKGRALGKGGARKGAGRPAKGIEKQSIPESGIDNPEPTPVQLIVADTGRSKTAVYRDNAKSKMAEATFDEPTLSEFRASKLHTEKNVKRYYGIAATKGKAAALEEFKHDKAALLDNQVKPDKQEKPPKPPKVSKPKPEPVTIPAAPVIETFTIMDEFTSKLDELVSIIHRMSDDERDIARDRWSRVNI